MAEFGKDEVPSLSDTIPKQSNEPDDSRFQSHVPRTRSVSISIPMIPMDPYERDTNLRGHTGPLRSKRKMPFSPMSGPLYVTPRPENLFWQNMVAPRSNAVESKTEKFPLCNIMSGHDLQNNYAGKNEHLVRSGPLGMCNDPYCTTCPTYFKATQQMDSKNSGLFNPKNAFYGDAKDWARRIFAFLIPNEHKCIVIDSTMTTVLILLRSTNDFIHFLNIILQIMILFFLPKHLGTSGANHAKNLLRGAVLAQYIPRLCRFLLPMLISPSGFIFESAWASFFINLFTFMLSGHVVGSWWYLFGLQVGLLLFALLIGNIQNFLQALGRRRMEMSLRQRDVEQWMSHRRLAEDLRRRVRQAERYNWAATRGVNEEILMENLPEDLQRDIRRHFFKFVKKVRIFSLMDDPILDAICERLRQKIYIKGSKILYDGGLVEKVVFVVRGKLESIGEDGIRVPLSEGNVMEKQEFQDKGW
ncbi:hypothetical protein TSUD_295740 [Trifolium subterraneum]|uniref:Cyclic nucleotide-binding domain-containing protein n=1 Tax=Trifolium subterraneum TaxID=3900 RepID=A0A2Z6MWN9_TRISU|nr:hypothetical protein TSUD_295740 [Trifolium subterraneum]